MNCAFDKEKLTGYYDGELGAAEKAEVERHIASCSECLRDLGDLKSAAILVKELPRLRAPASIAQGVSREIQAAGKIHVLAKFRRTLLWGSAVAAGLFVAVNAMYFGSLQQKAPMASQAPPAAPMARVLPRENAEKPEPDSGAAPSADRKASQNEELRQQDSARRELMERKSAAPAEEVPKQLAGADALKKADSKDETPRAREKALADAVPPPVTAAPAPAPAAPSTPPPPGAEAPKPTAALPAPTAKGEAGKAAPADKEMPKAEQAAAPKPEPASKPRGAVGALEARAELAPIHCTLSATQLSKARTRLEDALKKLGVATSPPPPAPVKAPRREPDSVLTIEITDAQLAALREELEKPGDAKLQQSNPVEPVLPQFRSGGIFAGGGKKDAATASAPAAKAKVESPKEVEDAAAEPRRKVTLHLVEVKTLPADAEDRPLKK